MKVANISLLCIPTHHLRVCCYTCITVYGNFQYSVAVSSYNHYIRSAWDGQETINGTIFSKVACSDFVIPSIPTLFTVVSTTH